MTDKKPIIIKQPILVPSKKYFFSLVNAGTSLITAFNDEYFRVFMVFPELCDSNQ